MDGLKPKPLLELLRTRDEAEIAMRVLHDLDNLGPMLVPSVHSQSTALRELMQNGPHPEVPKDLKAEWQSWHNSRLVRANAKAENLRRLRSTLWAEQCLRELGREEHEVLRAFNRDYWLVSQPAAADVAKREAQAMERT